MYTDKRSSSKTNLSSCATVLIVDSDTNQLDSYYRGLFLYGHRCIKAPTLSKALDILGKPNGPQIDLLITSVSSKDVSSGKLIRHARAMHPTLPIIAVCGLRSARQMETADQAITILKRPFGPDKLNNAVMDLVAGF